MLPIKAFIFDCDGTLISSQQGILLGVQTLMSEHLKRQVSLEEVVQKYSPDMSVIAERFDLDLKDPALLQWASKRWAQILQNTKSDYRAFEGIDELLQALQNKGIELYVWTARDRKSTRDLLLRLDLMKYFLDMRCFDDTTPKPHPQGIEELVPHILDRSQVAVIGDSTTDLQGAQSFGAQALAAFWCVDANRQAMKAMGPMACFEKPLQVLEWLENVEK